MILWRYRCPECGETFHSDHRFTAESMLRAHVTGNHPQSGEAGVNAVYRWGLSVAHARSLAVFGRFSPISGDHRDTWMVSRAERAQEPAVQDHTNGRSER